MEPAIVRPPSIVFNGRPWASEELAAVAAGWLDFVRASIPHAARMTALPLANHVDAVALFFALSTLRLPVIVLPPDARAWRSSPPIPPETPIFLSPSLSKLAGAGDALGLRTFVVPDPRPAWETARTMPFLTSPGFVNFTSGSTGLPRPVYILTQSFVRQTAAIVEACRLSRDDAVAASLPLSTHYGLGQALLLPTLLGSTLGLVERFDHRSLLRLFAAGSYAYWAATPLMADMLAGAPLSGPVPAASPICHISTGRLSLRVFRAFRERFGVAPRPNYGQTENGFITVDTAPDDEIRPGCVGRPAPGIEVRIGDDPLDPHPAGRLGRVWFTSPWYMEGYGFPPGLAPRENRRGWWPTQDIGSLDGAGYLTLAGRIDDCFKTAAGYLVNPGEITNAFMSHPAVRDVVVLPVSSSTGPMIGAVVESDGPVELDELRAVAVRMLPRWSHPQLLAVTGRLPRLTGGKADREACRALLHDDGTSHERAKRTG
jgi:acyl-CoA synthetase (AMP-forming)/AMP-acid ligase II